MAEGVSQGGSDSSNLGPAVDERVKEVKEVLHL